MKLGQHFLINTHIADKIVENLNFTYSDIVLEIGGGKGILTERIVNKVKKLYVVELDSKLYNLLITRLGHYKNIEIINADFLKFNLKDFCLYNNTKLKIVGNIPYSITSKVLEKIYTSDSWEMCILMLQKEVAQKLTANVGESYFSKLTLMTNFYTNIKLLFEVPKENFFPKPSVDSAVVKFVPTEAMFYFENKDKLLKLIDISFKHKRKTLINSLNLELKIDKRTLQKIFENLGIKFNIRPHQIGLNDYIKILEKTIDFIK